MHWRKLLAYSPLKKLISSLINNHFSEVTGLAFKSKLIEPISADFDVAKGRWCKKKHAAELLSVVVRTILNLNLFLILHG